MYRHHNTCQAAHEAGYRRGAMPKKSKRRSCERCSRLKCKCDDSSPCTRCLVAGAECTRTTPKQQPLTEPTTPQIQEEDLTNIHLLAHHASQTPKEEILSPAAISQHNFPSSAASSQSVPFQEPFQRIVTPMGA